MRVEAHSFTGLTEEQIKDIFGSAGKVMSFRLVYDRETGRPKGFGFVEFPDSGSQLQLPCAQRPTWRNKANFCVDSAASAVRNLNGYEIMGRTLRVDFSNDPGGDDEVSSIQLLSGILLTTSSRLLLPITRPLPQTACPTLLSHLKTPHYHPSLSALTSPLV
jgi:hypothetical protein